MQFKVHIKFGSFQANNVKTSKERQPVTAADANIFLMRSSSGSDTGCSVAIVFCPCSLCNGG